MVSLKRRPTSRPTGGYTELTNLVDEVEDLGQDADAFAVVDNVVVEVTSLLEYSALVQVGEGVD